MTIDYLHKARVNGIAVKIKHSTKGVLSSDESETLETTTERSSIPVVINDSIKTDRSEFDFQLNSSSTPKKTSSVKHANMPQSPRLSPTNQTSRAVRVDTPSVVLNQASESEDTVVSIRIPMEKPNK